MLLLLSFESALVRLSVFLILVSLNCLPPLSISSFSLLLLLPPASPPLPPPSLPPNDDTLE